LRCGRGLHEAGLRRPTDGVDPGEWPPDRAIVGDPGRETHQRPSEFSALAVRIGPDLGQAQPMTEREAFTAHRFRKGKAASIVLSAWVTRPVWEPR
jgi:hypothetical protein